MTVHSIVAGNLGAAQLGSRIVEIVGQADHPAAGLITSIQHVVYSDVRVTVVVLRTEPRRSDTVRMASGAQVEIEE